MRKTAGSGFYDLVVIVSIYASCFVRLILCADYVPADQYFLNCGTTEDGIGSDGREWTGDGKSKFFISASRSSSEVALYQDSSVATVPYMTSRISRGEFSYSFPVSRGRKLVRLHFYPSSYRGFNMSRSSFDVKSGSYTLLKNFSAPLVAEALNYAFIVKEYNINVETEILNLTFTPSPNTSDAIAFVNGIEVVSSPDIYSTPDGGIPIIGLNTQFIVDNGTALENSYRLNVGGNGIPPVNDTGMLRWWSDDMVYIFGASIGVTPFMNSSVNYPATMPTYVAPSNVYTTARTMGPDPDVNVNYNLTWIFSVDSGFFYMIRLHFCEIIFTKINQRVFDILINNQSAFDGADVVAWAGARGVPFYKDFIVSVVGNLPQQDLWLAIRPNTATKSNYYDAILNGIEIFKVSDFGGNLAGLNPIPSLRQTSSESPSPPSVAGKNGNRKAILAGAACGVAVLIAAAVSAAFCRLKRKKDSGSIDGPSGWLPLSLYGNSHSSSSAKTNTTGSHTSSLPANLCRHFTFAEIRSATGNFDEGLLLGVGGFGKVYRGSIDGGATKVAIKRANPSSEQGVHEFQTEIGMLSKLRHRHLVSLIGYCEENFEMILVYDYMSHGTLREHLYKTNNLPLPWKKRLEISIGAARGLHYLHTGAKDTIIHRDVKTTNILLDEKWVAKVSDFGLSKTGPALNHTHVSTVVKGSFGYLDPEYFRRQMLTDKSDVYSFGVVLFEILCARPALVPALPKEQVNLAEWASHCHKKGILDQIMDPYLSGRIAPECLKKFSETAMKCVADMGVDRPSMGDVLWHLEFALQLQEGAEERGDVIVTEDQVFVKKEGLDGNFMDSHGTGITVSIGGRSVASEDSDGLTPSAVFSQIMNPKGR